MFYAPFMISISDFQAISIRSHTCPTWQTAPQFSWVEMRTTSCWHATVSSTFCGRLTFLLWCWRPCMRLVAQGRTSLRAWWLRPKPQAPVTTSLSCWCFCASHGTFYSQRRRLQGKCERTRRKERHECWRRPLEGWWSLCRLTVSDVEASDYSVSYFCDLRSSKSEMMSV